jgi:hypothetical protein
MDEILYDGFVIFYKAMYLPPLLGEVGALAAGGVINVRDVYRGSNT